MAERTCGATDRLDQTRVPRPFDCVRRGAFASCASLICAVLQRNPNSSVTGQGLTSAKSCRCRREHCPAADPRRIAPPLCTDLINDRDTRELMTHRDAASPKSVIRSAIRAARLVAILLRIARGLQPVDKGLARV